LPKPRPKINRTIHYCWFGSKGLPLKYQNLIQLWHHYHPGWKIQEWGRGNLPNLKYLQNAMALHKYANASNWARLWVLEKYGGVYLDTDIEIVRPLDDLLQFPAFVGFEVKYFDWEGCVNNAVFGSIKNHWFVTEMRQQLEEEFDGSEDAHLSSPHLTTRVLKRHGLVKYGRTSLNGVEIFPIEYFYPFGWHETFRVQRVTPETRSIHWYGRSWLTQSEERKNFKSQAVEYLHKILWEKYFRKKMQNESQLSSLRA
jgi:mannosyltransferase OCH1-like enzyme